MKILIRVFFVLLLSFCVSALYMTGCGGGRISIGEEGAPVVPVVPSLPLGGTPLGLTATAANHQITLAWQAVENAAAYRIYTATTPGLTKSAMNKAAAELLEEGVTDTVYVHADLPNGILRCYAVEALGEGGAESGLSTEACGRPMPGTGTMSITPWTMQNTVVWDMMAGDVDSWNLYWKTGSGILNMDISLDLSVGEGTTKIENAQSPFVQEGLSNNNISHCYVLERVIGDVTDNYSEVCGTPYTVGILDYLNIVEKGFCYEWISDAKLDSQGRIVIAGIDQCGGKNGKDEIIFVARFLADGTLDTSFGVDGYFRGDPVNLPMVVSYFAFKRGERYSAQNKIGLGIDDNGKIIIAAAFLDMNIDPGQGDDIWYLLWRLTPEGRFDKEFGNGGVAAVSWGTADREVIGHEVFIDNNGKILAAGRTWNNLGIYSGAIWRLKDDGTLDENFNYKEKDQYGVFYNRVPGQDQRSLDVAIDSSGRMVVGGIGDISDKDVHHYYGMIWRFIIDETEKTVIPDTQFGNGNGGVQCMTEELSYIDSITIDNQGRILFAGAMPHPMALGADDAVIGRLTPEGELDEEFGDGGVFVVSNHIGGINDYYFADIKPDASGKIVAVGLKENAAIVYRLLENGTPDSSFGDNGVVKYEINDYHSAVRVMIDDMGRLILAGESVVKTDDPVDISIWRYK
jgi:uncharacterized delta-60 repeat protein